ncbi:Uncharacterized protein HZ326_20990 [Fusarium oxysporum f. sp. albedinis]|nr:Uncharacterized protein HZ326_20990 [Fusarium oxysporum f. sp. albedinis]
MSTLDAPAVSQRDQSRSRTRSPSPSDQLRPTKRPRPSQLPRFSPPLLANRPPSASSIATSIEQHYGIGDQDALGNLFASYPQTFSTFPRPHGSQGLHEPSWELRSDYEAVSAGEKGDADREESKPQPSWRLR